MTRQLKAPALQRRAREHGRCCAVARVPAGESLAKGSSEKICGHLGSSYGLPREVQRMRMLCS